MSLTSIFQFGIDQGKKKKNTTQTLFLINKNVMEISYVASAPKHFSATSGTASSFQPVYVHNENIFSSPVNNYCFPCGEFRGCPSLQSLKKLWL